MVRVRVSPNPNPKSNQGVIVGDGELATRFKRLTYSELPEENMQFLSELHALREEMGG